MISNSPYILVLDCDMYCNDPTSARRAVCFHLDSKFLHSLAFVQFPQRFHNISKDDIYDNQLRSAFSVWKQKLSTYICMYEALRLDEDKIFQYWLKFIPFLGTVARCRWAPGTDLVWYRILYQESVIMWRFYTRFVGFCLFPFNYR